MLFQSRVITPELRQTIKTFEWDGPGNEISDSKPQDAIRILLDSGYKGVWGVESASRRYFGKPAADLSDDEAALLAAALPSPRAWYPGSTSPAYQRHAKIVRRRMDKAQFLRRLL